MHAAGIGIDHARQLVRVSGLQLGQPAVLQQHLRQRVVLRQLAQHFLVGRWRAAGGLAHHRQLHAAEQDLAQLLGRIQVEGLPCQFIGLLLELQHFLAQLVALAAEFRRIDLDAVALDRGQHRRHLHLQQVDAFQPGIGRHLRAQHLVQLQREVGILGGVVAGLVHRHFVEADLLGTLAAQVFVRNPAAAQVALRQVVQADAAMRLQHVGLQHGVFGDARQADAFVGEHVGVVLGVMQQLGARGVFQPRTQPCQHLVLGQLRGAVRAAVRDRDIAGHARRHRHRQADQFGLHLVQRGGLRIHRHQRRLVHLFHPGVERRPVGNDAVIQLRGRGRHFGRHAGVARRHALGVAGQVSQPGAETVAFVQFGQGGVVAIARRQVVDAVDVAGQVAVALHRQQLARQREIGDGFAQVVARHALDAFGAFDQLVDRAELGDPFGGRLGADLGHARNVVDGIAHQHQVVDDAVRRHAELVEHAGLVQHLAAHGVDQGDVAVDQLRQVLVAGGHHRMHAAFGGAAGQRADHVIGLDPLDGQHRPTQGAHGAVDGLDLGRQVFRHGRTVRLVFRIQIVAERLATRIENTCGILCLIVGYKLAQHIDYAVQRTRRFALRIAQIRHSVESAVQVA